MKEKNRIFGSQTKRYFQNFLNECYNTLKVTINTSKFKCPTSLWAKKLSISHFYKTPTNHISWASQSQSRGRSKGLEKKKEIGALV